MHSVRSGNLHGKMDEIEGTNYIKYSFSKTIMKGGEEWKAVKGTATLYLYYYLTQKFKNKNGSAQSYGGTMHSNRI